MGYDESDQPLFVFTLLIDLPEDFAAEDFPSALVARLQDDLRAQIAGTPVDDWDWIVTVLTKAELARR